MRCNHLPSCRSALAAAWAGALACCAPRRTDNAYTRSVRPIVLRGEGTPPAAWRGERRDLQADFLRLFGIGAGADNTCSRCLSYIAGLVLQP